MSKPNKSKGEFFAIDRRTWASLCDIGSINTAAAYLVIAQGTGRDNRSTSWSVTSLKTYAGISWQRGTVAIQQLIDKGFIRHAETSTQKKPRYELLPPAEVAETALSRARAELTKYERSVLNDIERNKRLTPSQKQYRSEAFSHLEQLGLIKHQPDGNFTAIKVPILQEPDLIWLPNTLVAGTDKGEDSPIKRLRGGGDIWTLRLLIDLYYAHNLRDNGGIDPAVLCERYSRMLVGEQGLYKVWGFKFESYQVAWAGPLNAHMSRPTDDGEDDPIWDSVTRLQNHGLLSFVPHLWDNECIHEKMEAEIIHSYGIDKIGEPEEIEIGRAAHVAGMAMVPDFKKIKALEQRYYHLAPVLNTIPNVQMIGVARLRYRPHTARTSNWYGELVSNAPGWVKRYEEMREEAEKLPAKSA